MGCCVACIGVLCIFTVSIVISSDLLIDGVLLRDAWEEVHAGDAFSVVVCFLP